MIHIREVDLDTLSLTISLIANEVIDRGWNIYVPCAGSSLAFIDRGKGDNLRIFSSTPQTSSFPAAYLVNDKFATHKFLESHSLPVLSTVLVSNVNEFAEALNLMSNGKVVVKPLDAGHGKGISVGVETEESLKHAISYAAQYSKDLTSVIVQEMYTSPTDLRVLCINETVVAAAIRVPARVVGDGEHTIKELIALENATKRGEPYKSDLAYIDVYRAEQFLGENINNTPELGQKAAVLGTANIGSGGEAIDCTDDLPDWLLETAIKTASKLALPVCGVDFMVAQNPLKNSAIEDLRPVITEVNKCPSFGLHHNPTTGTPRNVSRVFVDYLETLP